MNKSYAWDDKIESLPHTTSKTISNLKRLGILTLFDLVFYAPREILDNGLVIPISDLNKHLFTTVLFEGVVKSAKLGFTKSAKTAFEAVIAQDEQSVRVVWFGQKYLQRVVIPGQKIRIKAKILRETNKLVGYASDFEIITSQAKYLLPMQALYPLKAGISGKTLQDKIALGISLFQDSSIDFFSTNIINSEKLVPLNKLLQMLHYPSTKIEYENAATQLALFELTQIALKAKMLRQQWTQETTESKEISISANFTKQFFQELPFTPTPDQYNAMQDILSDFSKKSAMNRLVQGDVGSGKTIIAMYGAYLQFCLGKKTLLMAPTAILARQHLLSFEKIFSSFSKPPKIALLTKSDTHIDPDFDIAIGTHVLLSSRFDFGDVGLVIVDEQHKFGVAQRSLIKSRHSQTPHLLSLTATPIPRTVALLAMSEVGLTEVKSMPSGRKSIKTFLVGKQKRESSFAWIKTQIQTESAQVFWVCPLIEKSENEKMSEVKAVEAEYEFLKSEFSQFRVQILHGKMKENEKNQIMQDFLEKKFDILLTTPVVEVGVDIPNATIIVIESSERYGLASLHQLRGRVGRSDRQSYALLFTSSQNQDHNQRLTFFTRTLSGFDLSEYDFKNRGAGNFLGLEQHGLSQLRYAANCDYTLYKKAALISEQIWQDQIGHELILSGAARLASQVAHD